MLRRHHKLIDGERLTIVVNPSAGSAFAPASTDALRAALPRADVVELEEGADLRAALEKAAVSERVRAIGVAGGDGSVNTAAEVAADHDLPLVVVPAGTLNHFARDLGVQDVDDVAEAVQDGHLVAVDLAEIDGRAFVNTASLGSYVDIVDARERLEGRIGKWPAVVVALISVLRHSEPVNVELDGRRRCLWMAFVGNCRYQPSGFAPSSRERLDDGMLDVRLVDGSVPFARAKLILAVLTGTLARCPVYESFVTDSFRVRSLDGPLRLARDGETFDGRASFDVCKRGQLAVYVPRIEQN